MALQFDHLNPRQRDAVFHLSGPLLILAGAGSGKTSTMAYRMAYLIAHQSIAPSQILGLSFTNKAATELKERVTRLIHSAGYVKASKGLTVTTFHSLCVRILRKQAERIGYSKTFTIADRNDQIDLLKQVFRNIKIDDRKFDLDLILFKIGQAKNKFLTPENSEEFFFQKSGFADEYAYAAFSAYGHYQNQLKLQNAMDFDDLIFQTVELFEKHPDALAEYNDQFRYLLVDEYQDTNPAQFKILKFLTQVRQNLCVVGDDDQSIYSWRGADPSHILEFKSFFPDARVIALEQNYRSTSKILDAANAVIEKNKNRYPKKLWSDRGDGEHLIEVVVNDDRAEADFIAEEILRRHKEHNRLWSEFAILYRSNSQSRVFEEACRRNSIPYKIIGALSFLERKEVKVLLSYFKIMVNPADDQALRRIINWPGRGIGKTTLEALNQESFSQEKALFSVLKEDSERLVPKASSKVLGFVHQLEEFKTTLGQLEADPQKVSEWALRLVELLGIKKEIIEENEDPVVAARKYENVEELIHSLGQMRFHEENPGSVVKPNGTDFLKEFVHRMTLEALDQDNKSDDKDSNKNEVTLLTLHGAKGLEYPIVFLVGMEEGMLPHKRTLEELTDLSEERRLCYVGITRAKDFLFLVRTKNRIRYGKPVPRAPSRFLADIPKELVISQDQSGFVSQSEKDHQQKVLGFLSQIKARLGNPK